MNIYSFGKLNRILRSVISLNRKDEFKFILKYLNLNDKDSLLDVGSGDGYWTYKFADHCGKVIGVDPSDNLLTLAKKHYKKESLSFEYGSAEQLPYDTESFSKITSVSTIEHFENPIKGLGEMCRVLKINGTLSISFDSLNDENSSEKFRKWHAKKHYVNNYFTLDAIERILNENRMKMDKECIFGIFKSRLSCFFRELFIKNPRKLLPFFPLIFVICRISDFFYLGGKCYPQIIIIKAKKYNSIDLY
jgi:ubiquinone/menaquinone biosynthesis C-methylase UbiE